MSGCKGNLCCTQERFYQWVGSTCRLWNLSPFEGDLSLVEVALASCRRGGPCGREHTTSATAGVVPGQVVCVNFTLPPQRGQLLQSIRENLVLGSTEEGTRAEPQGIVP